MPDDAPPDRFDPLRPEVRPAVPITGYPSTVRRNPNRAPFRRPLTRSEVTGPRDLAPLLQPGDNDLARLAPGRIALGQLIQVAGRIMDEDGRPVRGAVVEIWQANAAGRYLNPLDTRDAPIDPDFIGHGRTRTDGNGRYAFFTIKPGAYPVPESGRWWRPPHIHLSVLGPSCLSRLVTQMYFPGDPLNAHDRLLNAVPDAAARESLVAQQLPPVEVPGEWLGFVHDLVLRGRRATPAMP
ncbi:MAG TPA: protocatechuate 3,4-dioxygenase subunit beta [Falsiroseomonas sp.]|jgi:protocatechuate 3,4-dioxygenase beta subunit|nr:protocatechuate 3,4-dioxygenase subunit beta [Falsiroseomonas sp.]